MVSPVAVGCESGFVITQQQHPNALCANYLPHMPKGLPIIV